MNVTFDCWCAQCVTDFVQKDEEFDKPCYVYRGDPKHLLFVPLASGDGKDSEARAREVGDALIAEEQTEKEERERRAKRNKANKARQKAKRRGTQEISQEEATSDLRRDEDKQDDSIMSTTTAEDHMKNPQAHGDAGPIVLRGTQSKLGTLFSCPASGKLLTDPVLAADGCTYDKTWLETWFKAGHVTSPTYGKKLQHTSFVANYVIRRLVTDWVSMC